MQKVRFKLTKEAESWLEKNRLMIENCTIRVDWSDGAITISVFRENKIFLVCDKFSLGDTLNVVDIPGVTVPIEFDR